MAKKKLPKRKFQDPNLYFKKTGDRCSYLRIKFLITPKYIVATIYKMVDQNGDEDTKYKEDKLTKPNIERKLRRLLENQGTEWLEDIEYRDSVRGEAITDSVMWKKSEEHAKRLYPKWFKNYLENSVRLILED